MEHKKMIIWVMLALIIQIGVADALTYCDGDALVENISVDGTVITISNVECDIGCGNFTLWRLGQPGCQENEFQLSMMLIIFAIIAVLIIRGVFR